MIIGGGKMNVLPRADEAVIPIEKFTEYALNDKRDFHKSVAFSRALGYNLNNYQHLIDNIRANLRHFPAKAKGDKGHGERYEVIMRLVGPNGRVASVLTAWIDDKQTGKMRLINAYVDRRKRGSIND